MPAPVPWVELQCQHCGRSFQKPPSQAVNRKYCSRDCKDAAQTKTGRADIKPAPDRVATVENVPYGYCHCGCGEKTPLATATITKYGHVKGEPLQYIFSHINRGRPSWNKGITASPQPEFSDHLCECGCGQPTRFAPKKGDGYEKGEPLRFLRGHASRAKSHQMGEDMGDPNPSGFCLCGCGQKTPIAKVTRRELGHVKGKHTPYCKGHSPYNAPIPLETLLLQHVSAIRRRQIRLRWAGGKHTDAEIAVLYIEQKVCCAYCQTDISNGFHEDHRRPLSRGGSDDITNIALACATCNHKKWIRTDAEFMDYLIYGARSENMPQDWQDAIDEMARNRLATQSEAPWSRAYPQLSGCRQCGRSDVRHCAFGLCKRCYRTQAKN
jgi:5-methylcytosine-specific restriction endonuclease McrA